MLRLLILLSIGVLGCQADCGACSSSTGIACVSENQYQFCNSESIPQGNISFCPNGSYCTSNPQFCSPLKDQVACNECENCGDDKVFACISQSTFALCLGTGDPSKTITGSCAPDYVCKADNPHICVSAAEVVQASCLEADPTDPTPTDTTPTDPIDLTPTAYCEIMKEVGRYPYGNNQTSTCKQYISCYKGGSNWYGTLYNCAGSTYFDSTKKMCTPEIPARCKAGVATLRLRNMIL